MKRKGNNTKPVLKVVSTQMIATTKTYHSDDVSVCHYMATSQFIWMNNFAPVTMPFDNNVSGTDWVLEETMIYSFISVDKCANDAEHHLRANVLQPVTAAKVSSFFFLFASLMLT
jgi:hypothetical protein